MVKIPEILVASLVVHAQEILETEHPVDRDTLRSLVEHPAVVAWLASINPSLLPVKRAPTPEVEK